jgi:hypothetical protein
MGNYDQQELELLKRFNRNKKISNCIDSKNISDIETLAHPSKEKLKYGTATPIKFTYKGKRQVGYMYPPRNIQKNKVLSMYAYLTDILSTHKKLEKRFFKKLMGFFVLVNLK